MGLLRRNGLEVRIHVRHHPVPCQSLFSRDSTRIRRICLISLPENYWICNQFSFEGTESTISWIGFSSIVKFTRGVLLFFQHLNVSSRISTRRDRGLFFWVPVSFFGEWCELILDRWKKLRKGDRQPLWFVRFACCRLVFILKTYSLSLKKGDISLMEIYFFILDLCVRF